MPPNIKITESSSPQSQARKQMEDNGRIRDWLLDPGLNIQGRLLAGPAQPQASEKNSTELHPKAHL
ncbi:uncharacterized protein FTOL_00426 [Fusarium torulosum]|uniref:Uncharacterized protein n=1 Tax=Fusarium torulosum TaxID=33205 RepID=A0AAE8LYC7_9HYPO|nr:uncharacterized protein FTOL_00426 [Fusarium torulosum]